MKNPQITYKKSPLGFTLIELLVVIGIISLLMAILVPVIGRAKGAAQSVVCKANLRSIGAGFRMYLDDNKEMFPPALPMPSYYTILGIIPPPGPNEPNSSQYGITYFLSPYMKEPKVYKCPSDPREHYFLTEKTSYEYNASLIMCVIKGDEVFSTFRNSSRGNIRQRNVLNDFDIWHGTKKPGKAGSKNYLYADWHVGDITGG
jgi:prepilin-type N-terminal cleavage/methylation domain-containing protein/prepilin-type processing-associated H-X9-DG protein